MTRALEREYQRQVGRFAKLSTENQMMARVDACLRSGTEWMMVFNAEYKRHRLAGLTKLPYSAALKRFRKLLCQRLLAGWRNGDLYGVIEASLK